MSEVERQRRLFLTARRTLIVVVREDNKASVRIYKRALLRSRYSRVRAYRARLGRLGYETPRGVFTIVRKSDKPEWRMPYSSWVPEKDQGKVVPYGHPNNPIKGAFLSIDSDDVGGVEDGVGFHGSSDVDAGGGSHGCIRLEPEHAREMFDIVPTGTPVVFA